MIGRCQTISEIQGLALQKDKVSPALDIFLQHVQQCDRCRFIWAEACAWQEEIDKSLNSEFEAWEQIYSKALASGEAVALTPLPAHEAAADSLNASTVMAADSGEKATQRLREFSILTSEAEGVILRILLDEDDNSLHFYISQKSPPAQPMALYLPEVKEPLPVDESGYTQLPADSMRGVPEIVLLAPLRLE